MSHFFTEPQHHQVSITRKGHLLSNSRGEEPLKITPLNAAGDGARLVVRMIELCAANASSSLEDSGETCGIFHVLEGRMELDAGGMHETLDAGDCAYIESQMPILVRAAGKQSCRILAVTPPHSNS
jgi:glyoxylate utilization-related uncharacterized protein